MQFWNAPELIRWNLSKRYLLDLERAGVAIIPTVILDHAGPTGLPTVLAERGWDRAVVKPVLAASAHDAVLVTAETAAAASTAIDEGRVRRPVMVQPFVDEIRTRGEWSLVFIDGALTHAVLKRPSREVVAAGGRVLAALPLPPLYARVDGIETEAGFLVMEVELHEPGLFFAMAPAAAEAFAQAIIRRL